MSKAALALMLEISGDRIVKATFEQLANKETRRAARKALTSGMQVLTKALKAASPVAKTEGHSGRGLRQAIRSRHVRNKRTGIAEAKVGIGVGKKTPARTAKMKPHFHLVALGTEPRHTGARQVKGKRGTGRRIITGNPTYYRGRMPANPFVATTSNALSRAVNVHMADVFVHEIEQAARRLANVPGN